MECHNVCKVWKELLSRQSYRQIEKKLLKEKEEKVEELCEASSKGDLDKVNYCLIQVQIPTWQIHGEMFLLGLLP